MTTEPSLLVGQLCADAQERVLGSIDEVTLTLRRELPSYSRLTFDDQRRTVQEMIDLLFQRLGAGTGPSAEDLAFARRAAKRRASEGVSAYDVLGSFNVVTSVIWDALRDSPHATDHLLLTLVAPLNRWTRQMSEAVVDAFSGEYPEVRSRQSDLRERFFETLGARPHAAELVDLAHELAFDPAGSFQAVSTPTIGWSADALAILQRSTRQLPGTVHFGYRGDRIVGIAQATPIHDVVAIVRETSGSAAPVGVGLSRPELHGAQLSLEDAERTLRVAIARDEPVAEFETAWLDTLVADNESRLAILFARAHKTALSAPDLAATVLAFADGGLTLAGASRLLNVHANSVAYRLDRWRTLTGLDPRSYDGLIRSVLAIGRNRRTTDNKGKTV